MPFIRTPFTDLLAGTEDSENVKKCQEFNMQLALCKEAYGMHRFQEKCKAEYDDFNECILGWKQRRRAEIMRKEREKKFKEGKLPEQYAQPPPLDSISDEYK